MSALNASDRLAFYRLLTEEVRFQVDLNWRRSQYYLALNLAVIGVGAGFLRLQNASAESVATGAASSTPTIAFVLPAAVFVVGIATAFVALLSNRTQHNYYRAVRDERLKVERRLGFRDLAIRTTPGMGSRRSRFGSVSLYNALLMWVIIIVDAGGVAYSVLSLFRVIA